MDTEAADGILHTEHATYENKSTDTRFPKTIEAKYIRAAHLYNITFSAVRENFAIAGLQPMIEVKNRQIPILQSFFLKIYSFIYFTANNAV